MTSDPTPPDEVGTDHVPTFAAGVTLVPVEDEAVLYDETGGTLHLLDPIGALVCRLFDGDASVAVLTAELSEAFEVEPARIEADVLGLVRSLGGHGLLAGIAREHDLEEPTRIERELVDGC